MDKKQQVYLLSCTVFTFPPPSRPSFRRWRNKVMDRNDARVAEVWMDDYKELFFNARGLQGLVRDVYCAEYGYAIETLIKVPYTRSLSLSLSLSLSSFLAGCWRRERSARAAEESQMQILQVVSRPCPPRQVRPRNPS
jgi:hypothetical protein